MAGNGAKLRDPRSRQDLHDFQAELATVLLDDAPAQARPAGERTDGAALAVYRNNVLHSLTQALAASFPVVQRLTGEEFFSYAARTFIRRHPPRSPLTIEVGRQFDRFLAGFEPAATLPYLADVARLEQAWLAAYHAADAPPLDPRTLSAVAPQQQADLRFQLHPATHLVTSPYPIVAIWLANTGEAANTKIELGAGGECALVTRPHLQVSVRAIEPGLAALIGALGEGETLSGALERATNAAPDLALDRTLRDLLESGCVMDIQTAA